MQPAQQAATAAATKNNAGQIAVGIGAYVTGRTTQSQAANKKQKPKQKQKKIV